MSKSVKNVHMYVNITEITEILFEKSIIVCEYYRDNRVSYKEI